MNKLNVLNLMSLVTVLRQQRVIAYPTEAVFGLGCDPDSESAVDMLLKLKQRSWQKGLILVSAHYTLLKKYVDDNALDDVARTEVFANWPGPVTYVIRAHPTVPRWLTGQHSSLAVRVSAFKPIRQLCLEFGKPLVSTSANLAGQLPARSAADVRRQFGSSFPLLDERVGGQLNPSEIRDALSGKSVRQG